MSKSKRNRSSLAAKFKLRLYIAGSHPTSQLARANVESLCAQKLGDGNYDLEIVDIIADARRALDDGILVTPTLIKVAPLPAAKVVGDLSRIENLLIALGL